MTRSVAARRHIEIEEVIFPAGVFFPFSKLSPLLIFLLFLLSFYAPVDCKELKGLVLFSVRRLSLLLYLGPASDDYTLGRNDDYQCAENDRHAGWRRCTHVRILGSEMSKIQRSRENEDDITPLRHHAIWLRRQLVAIKRFKIQATNTKIKICSKKSS